MMAALDTVIQLDPIASAFLDSLVVSLTLVGGLYIWVLPRLNMAINQAQDQEQLQDTLINAIPAPIFYKNRTGVYTGCNKQFEDFIGLKRDQIIGQTVYDVAPSPFADVYHKADLDLMQRAGTQVYEAMVNHADGTKHDVMFHKAVFHKSNGDAGGIIGIMLDITSRKELERKLQNLASMDALTGLPNRRELDNRLEQALARAARSTAIVALLFIDMDGFKDVNDLHGHECGDRVLKAIADRITMQLRKSDIAGRMGGDEFAVVLEGNMSHEAAALVASKLLVTLAAPYELANGHSAQLSASIGIAFSPDDGNDLKQLLAQADGAMYEAKRLGKNRFILAGEAAA